jgi:hypothetical protein
MRAFILDPGVSSAPSWSRPELRFRNMVRKVVFYILYYKICIPVIWYMSFIYLVYLMILIPNHVYHPV